MNKEILRNSGVNKEVDVTESNLCPFCRYSVKLEDFKNKFFLNEYQISGLCQECMDKIFTINI
jgi:hypothetical protein